MIEFIDGFLHWRILPPRLQQIASYTNLSIHDGIEKSDKSIITIVNKHAPEKTIRVCYKKSQWITPDVLFNTNCYTFWQRSGEICLMFHSTVICIQSCPSINGGKIIPANKFLLVSSMSFTQHLRAQMWQLEQTKVLYFMARTLPILEY